MNTEYSVTTSFFEKYFEFYSLSIFIGLDTIVYF